MLPPPEFLLTALGYGVLAPAVVTALGLLLALRLGGGEPVAVGAGLVAGFAALAAGGLIGWGLLDPTKAWDWRAVLALLASAEAWDWLAPLALLALAAALVGQLGNRPHFRWAARLAVAGLTAWLLVRAQSAREPVGPLWGAALALAVLVLWGLLDLAARREPGVTLPALLALVAFATGAVAELANFSTPAHLAGVLAAVLAGSALVAWRRPREAVARAAVPALAVMLPGLLFVTVRNTFSDVPPSSYLLLLAAPLCPGAAVLLPLGRVAGRWEIAVRAASALVPLGAALALAALA